MVLLRQSKHSLKLEVWERDNFTCIYCGRNMRDLYNLWRSTIDGTQSKKKIRIKRKHVMLSVDHVIPVSKGGTWDKKNLVTSCSKCNNDKGDKLIDIHPLLK